MNENVAVVSASKPPTAKFSDGGKSITIKVFIKSSDFPDRGKLDAQHPKRDTHRGLLGGGSAGDNFYGGGLSVSLLGLANGGALMNISMKVASKVPGGG